MALVSSYTEPFKMTRLIHFLDTYHYCDDPSQVRDFIDNPPGADTDR